MASKLDVGAIEAAGIIRANVSDGSGFSVFGTDTSVASGLVRNSSDGIALRTTTTDRLVIDGAGQVGIGVAPNIGGSSANNTFLSVKGKATAYAGVIELANYGTNGNGQTIGSVSYFDNTVKTAEIEVTRESANDDAKMVFKTKPTGGGITARLTIDSAGNVGVGVTPTSELTVGKTDAPQIDLVKNSTSDAIASIYAATDTGTGGKLIFKTKRNGDSALDRLTIDEDGLATFSGNTEHGGADGVQTFYAHGIAAGDATWYVDVPCHSDAGIATVFKVEASFSHCDCGYTAILETWTATRATSATSYEVKRLDSSPSGVWSVSKTSNTNFRVTHTAGAYSGTGPYWVKVTHRNA